MRLTTLWVVDGDDPDRVPYLLEAFDEHLGDEHGGTPDFFIERIDKVAAHGDEWRIVHIDVDAAAVLAAFEAPAVKGTVVDA